MNNWSCSFSFTDYCVDERYFFGRLLRFDDSIFSHSTMFACCMVECIFCCVFRHRLLLTFFIVFGGWYVVVIAGCLFDRNNRLIVFWQVRNTSTFVQTVRYLNFSYHRFVFCVSVLFFFCWSLSLFVPHTLFHHDSWLSCWCLFWYVCYFGVCCLILFLLCVLFFWCVVFPVVCVCFRCFGWFCGSCCWCVVCAWRFCFVL